MSRPRIGLNCDVACDGRDRPPTLKLRADYADAVARAGGLPLLLPTPAGDLEAWAAACLDAVDGLVLTGGRDYDPRPYGQEPHPATRLVAPRREAFDPALAHLALRRGLPVLGICGGMQLLNIVLGGDLVQDLPPRPVRHRAPGEARCHEVAVEAGSRLAAIVGEGRLEVNSSHHQALGRVAEGLRVVARAPDGVVEAVEGTGAAFVLGVQWHPERLASRAEQLALFRALVEAAGRGFSAAGR
ncbi:MAG: gamma-glutamyl-gamma-aminobutyrate hydrolase family protein [Candidatus Brocadiia bacterium]